MTRRTRAAPRRPTSPETRAPRKRRRTQAERSAGTRAKLMDAAIACLLERGYAGATTSEVAERAGVSRGAQLHHFPTKAEMVAHAVRHLAEEWIAEFRRGQRSIPPGGDRTSAVIDLLWHSFSGPLFMAAVELWVAARTDRELHATLISSERETGRSIAKDSTRPSARRPPIPASPTSGGSPSTSCAAWRWSRSWSRRSGGGARRSSSGSAWWPSPWPGGTETNSPPCLFVSR